MTICNGSYCLGIIFVSNGNWEPYGPPYPNNRRGYKNDAEATQIGGDFYALLFMYFDPNSWDHKVGSVEIGELTEMGTALGPTSGDGIHGVYGYETLLYPGDAADHSSRTDGRN